ncbi:hypothetical protein ACWNYO_00190 [Candidatus Vidania fulgoroideorum]
MFNKIKRILHYISKNNIEILNILYKNIFKNIFILLIFKKYFYIKSKKVRANNKSIIITGTGGDKKNTINVTSMVSIILSDIFKLKIFKYGSKSYSSKIGSIDFLEYFLKKHKTKLRIIKSSKIFNVDKISKLRKRIKKRTIFNYIFSIINLTNSNYQILGTSNLRLHKILRYIKAKNIMYIGGIDGMDEASTHSPTKISILKNGKIGMFIINKKTILETKKIVVNSKRNSYKIFIKMLRNNNIKLLFLNILVILKYIKKNKNIYFVLKKTFSYKVFKYVKFFKKNSK